MLPLIASVAGCASTPTYDAQTACSLAADDVATLLDTDRFVAESGQFPELPTGIPKGSRVFSCTASGGDRDLLAGVDLVGSVAAERARSLIERSPRTFPVGEGVAVNDATGAMWACGSVVARIEVRKQDRSAGLDVESSALQAAITDVADAVGCQMYPTEGS
ncbi:hypothetical protein [Aeromicrobium sp. CF3.5]|uniref:hypothetical protein n=1 Tax=Aeromicrobium sp. CF3.5 TaxID=3373078 RepID=UPI003EE5F7C1